MMSYVNKIGLFKTIEAQKNLVYMLSQYDYIVINNYLYRYINNYLN